MTEAQPEDHAANFLKKTEVAIDKKTSRDKKAEVRRKYMALLLRNIDVGLDVMELTCLGNASTLSKQDW